MRKLITGFAVLLLILSVLTIDNYRAKAETVHLSGSNIYFTIPDIEDSLTAVHSLLKVMESAIEDTLTDVHGKVEVVDSVVDAAADTLTDIHGKVQIVDSVVDALADTLTDTHEAVKIFESATGDTLTDVHGKIEIVDSVVDALADTLTDVHENLTTRIVDFESATEDTLTDIHEEAALNGTKTDAVADTLTDVHENLTGRIVTVDTVVDNIVVDLYAGTIIATTTEDLAQVVASYTLFTGTTADVILESLTLRNANVDCSDDATFTGISIQTDDATATTFISQANGVKANLTEEAQIAWTGSAIIKTATIINLTIYGAAADDTCAPDIMVAYRSTGTGTGTLVP